MSEKLERPSQETIQGIRRQIINAGFEDHEVPYDWIEIATAAMTKWIQSTPDGAQFAVQALGFDWSQGEEDKEYRIIDGFNQVKETIPSDAVFFFRGAMARGKLVPHSQIQVAQKESEVCEACHISSHCTKDILDPYTHKLVRLCNYCTSFHEHPKVSDQGSYRICGACPKESCGYHPNRSKIRDTA